MRMLPTFAGISIALLFLSYLLLNTHVFLILSAVLLVALVVLDRYIFLRTAFYGLEEILFSALLLTLLAQVGDSLLVVSGLTSFAHLTIFTSVPVLTMVFFTAGLDKIQSKDWRRGDAFAIWANLPFYRLFRLNHNTKALLNRVSPLISRFEIFHQFFFTAIYVSLLFFGYKAPLNLFLSLSLLFMSTLIWPFNLNPIGIWGLIVVAISIIEAQQLEPALLPALGTVSILFTFLTLWPRFRSPRILRYLFGTMKCALFSEYHIHGGLVLGDTTPLNIFKSLDQRDGVCTRRPLLNNMHFLTLNRLLDVLERAKQRSNLTIDYLFLEEFIKVFPVAPDHGGFYNYHLAQVSWNYTSSAMSLIPFTLSLPSDEKLVPQSLVQQANALPCPTFRNAVFKGSCGIGFSEKSIFS